MDIELKYQHNSKRIKISFYLTANEDVVVAVGFGKTCDDAKNNLRGWLTKEDETSNKEYICEEDKPFIVLIKKTLDGKFIQSEPCINIFTDMPGGEKDQITTRKISF